VGLLDGVAHRPFEVDLVAVPSTDPRSHNVALSDEVGDDRLCSALGDADPLRNIAASNFGVCGDTNQHMAVVGEKRPAGSGRFARLTACSCHS
jgi:hypothetical protein